ncbi:TPA: hypothetical protein MIZ55_12490 [Klebsiella pneumoniae]|nr:hypothetical protein KPNIH27_09765 [Klebsiella pneumoniae subsp. pneumoniae KPNIH27]ATQ89125.1 hypothetical protein CTI52_15255 [Klebsiella pneumoniae]QBQ71915.1 hypothetical protein [Klebsiella phage ST13-OXA48phi12.4]ATQ94526.1 hypothetical protein CTI54_15250 [Klebsiella pneumoniae]OKO65516.1 hypothetical protein BTN83_09225 [Klebsiella pneumoniae]
MSISTLVKTIVVSDSVAGEYKFEIFQGENAHFYADIFWKNHDRVWVIERDGYRFTRALDVEDAVTGSIRFVENRATDLKAIEEKKRTS